MRIKISTPSIKVHMSYFEIQLFKFLLHIFSNLNANKMIATLNMNIRVFV